MGLAPCHTTTKHARQNYLEVYSNNSLPLIMIPFLTHLFSINGNWSKTQKLECITSQCPPLSPWFTSRRFIGCRISTFIYYLQHNSHYRKGFGWLRHTFHWKEKFIQFHIFINKLWEKAAVLSSLYNVLCILVGILGGNDCTVVLTSSVWCNNIALCRMLSCVAWVSHLKK